MWLVNVFPGQCGDRALYAVVDFSQSVELCKSVKGNFHFERNVIEFVFEFISDRNKAVDH